MAAEALVAAVKKITCDALARFTVFRAGQNDCCFDETVALRGWEELLYGLLPRPWASRARDTRGGGARRFEALDLAWEPTMDDLPLDDEGRRQMRVPMPVFRKMQTRRGRGHRRLYNHYSLLRMFSVLGPEWCVGGSPRRGRAHSQPRG
jgi:hypothetical protein